MKPYQSLFSANSHEFLTQSMAFTLGRVIAPALRSLKLSTW